MKKLNPILTLIPFLIAAASLNAQQTVAVDQTSLSFSAQPGGQTPATQTLNVTSPNGSVLFSAQSNAAWLLMTNSSNATPIQAITGTTASPSAALSVTANPTGLPAGRYNGTITVAAFGSSTSVPVAVTLTISSIGVSQQNVAFTFQSGTGALPAPATINLTGQGQFTATAVAKSGGNWFSVSPPTGTLPSTGSLGLLVTLDPVIAPALAAGTYQGTVTITPAASSGNTTPVDVPVTLTVTAAPTVTVSASTLNLNYQIGGANNQQAQQTLTLSTNSTQPVNYSIFFQAANNPTGGSNWIAINPPNGTIPANSTAQVTVSYQATSTATLPVGTWTGTLTIFTPGAQPSQQNVALNLLVSNSPLLTVPSSTLTFNYQLNGTTPPAQSVTATSTAVLPTSTTGQMPITITATTTTGGPWLSVPSTGITGTAFTVSTNPAGLAPGKYQGTVTVTGTGAGNSSQQIPVTLTVSNDPLIVTSPTADAGLTFLSQISQSPVATAQTSRNISITSSNGVPLNYTATATTATGGSWLVLSGGTTGTTPGTLTVTVQPGTLAAGTYTGTISVAATVAGSGAASPNSPLNIPVKLIVSADPLLVYTLPGNPPAPPSFTAQVNGAAPASQFVQLFSSNPAVTLNYTVGTTTTNCGNLWLSVTPIGGTTAPGQNLLKISVDPTLLSPVTCTGTVTVTASNPGGQPVADSPVVIPVTFQVTAGTLTPDTPSVSFSQTAGGPTATKNVQLTSTGTPLTYTATVFGSGSQNWLTVTPLTGTTPGTIAITADPSKLTAGQYTGSVTLTAPNAVPLTIPVTLAVNAGTISADKTSLTFTQAAGGSAPQPQTINVTGSPSSLGFTVTTTGGAWLTATPASSNTPGAVQVSVNAGTMTVGQYTGSVVITSAGSTGSPITVPVTFNVVAAQTITPSPSSLSFTYTIGASSNVTSLPVQLNAAGNAQFTATASTTTGGSWLSVAPSSGTAAGTTLTVTVNPQGLAAGNYSGTVSINSSSLAAPVTIPVSLSVVAIPPPVFLAAKNSASYASGAISPGELIVVGGTGVGPATLTYGQLNSNNTLQTNVAGTQVLFDGVPGPIYYAWSTQTAVFVPYEVAGRPTTNITVIYQGGASTPLTYNVVQAVPGIFTQNFQGFGPGSILNAVDYSANGPNNGAAKGSYVSVFMTGEGQTSPAGVTGKVNCPAGQTCTVEQLPVPVLNVTATVDGIPAPVVFYGEAPGDVSGIMQVNVQIPVNARSGAVPIVINVGNNPSQNGVTVQVQ